MMKQDFSVQDEDAESARKASVEEKKRQEAASEIKVRQKKSFLKKTLVLLLTF